MIRGSAAVADPDMDGPGGLPPPFTKRGWSRLREAVCLEHRGQLSFKALTFGPICMKMDKKLSASGALPP